MSTSIFNSILYTVSILTILCIEPKSGVYLLPVAILLIGIEWVNTCSKVEVSDSQSRGKSHSRVYTISSIIYITVSISMASLLSYGSRFVTCILIVTSLLTAICMSNQIEMFATYIETKDITISATLIYIIKFVASIVLSVSVGFTIIQLLPLIQ